MIAAAVVAGCQSLVPAPTSAETVRGTVEATSAPAQLGVPYGFSLWTHCGLEEAPIDFDRSMWTIIDPPAVEVIGEDQVRLPFDDPAAAGTITLVGANEATFRATEGVVVHLVRHGPSKELVTCY